MFCCWTLVLHSTSTWVIQSFFQFSIKEVFIPVVEGSPCWQIWSVLLGGLELFLVHSEYWNISLLFNNIFICIYVYRGTCVEVMGLLLRVSSLLLYGFYHRTRVTGPGGRHLYVLSQLTSLRMFSKCLASLPYSILSMF